MHETLSELYALQELYIEAGDSTIPLVCVGADENNICFI